MVENEVLYSIQYSCDAFTEGEELQKKKESQWEQDEEELRVKIELVEEE